MISFINILILISLHIDSKMGLENYNFKENQIQADVVYGHKDGMALTYDIIAPQNPNGAAVICLVSFRWKSQWIHPNIVLMPNNPWTPLLRGLLDDGFCLYFVRHGSAPKYKIPDCISDVRKAVRHIRENSKKNNVNKEKIFSMGISAGGHLSLLLATDPSPKIAGSISLCPPTIMKNVQNFKDQTPAFDYDPSLNKSLSPALRINKKTPPVIIFQGDKDEIVIPDHAYKFESEMKSKNRPIDLIVVENATHYFTKEQLQKIEKKARQWIKNQTAKNIKPINVGGALKQP